MPAPPAASPVPMLVISLHRPHVPCTLLHPLPTVTKRHRRAADVATSRRRRHGARGLGRGLQLGPKRLWGREGGGQGRGQRWKSLEGGEAEGFSSCRRALLSFVQLRWCARPRPSARAADRRMRPGWFVACGGWLWAAAQVRWLLCSGVVQVYRSHLNNINIK